MTETLSELIKNNLHIPGLQHKTVLHKLTNIRVGQLLREDKSILTYLLTYLWSWAYALQHNYEIRYLNAPTHFLRNYTHQPDVIRTSAVHIYTESVEPLRSFHNPVTLVMDLEPDETTLLRMDPMGLLQAFAETGTTRQLDHKVSRRNRLCNNHIHIQVDLYCCNMFQSYKIIIRQLYIRICIVTELLIWIHISATHRIIY
jgi:hypothetical protein